MVSRQSVFFSPKETDRINKVHLHQGDCTVGLHCSIFPQLLSLTSSNFLSMNFIFKLLFKFLMYLMHHGLTGFGDEVDCNTLKYPQVRLLVLLSFPENHPQLLLQKIFKWRKARFNVNNVLLSSKPMTATFSNVLGFLDLNSVIKR